MNRAPIRPEHMLFVVLCAMYIPVLERKNEIRHRQSCCTLYSIKWRLYKQDLTITSN